MRMCRKMEEGVWSRNNLMYAWKLKSFSTWKGYKIESTEFSLCLEDTSRKKKQKSRSTARCTLGDVRGSFADNNKNWFWKSRRMSKRHRTKCVQLQQLLFTGNVARTVILEAFQLKSYFSWRLIQCCTSCNQGTEAVAYDVVAKTLLSEQCFDRYGEQFCSSYVRPVFRSTSVKISTDEPSFQVCELDWCVRAAEGVDMRWRESTDRFPIL